MVSLKAFTTTAVEVGADGGANYVKQVSKATVKTVMKGDYSKMYKALKYVSTDAIPKALTSSAAKKIYAFAFVAGMAVTADAVLNTIEKNNTPLDIVSITNAPNSTNLRIKFLNPKPIEIASTDSFLFTLTDSDPVLDGEYDLAKVISQTEVEIESTVKLKTAGTKGTINVHTTFWREFEDTVGDTTESIANFSENLLEAPFDIMKWLKIGGFVIAGIFIFFAIIWCIRFFKPHHRMARYGRHARDYIYSMRRPWRR